MLYCFNNISTRFLNEQIYTIGRVVSMQSGLVHIINREILEHKKSGKIKAVGMDLDGSLTDLHRPEIYELIWENALGFMSSPLRNRLQTYTFEDLTQNGDFKVGWFLDVKLGYTVITDSDGKILAVKKGNEHLGREKIFKAYGPSGVIDTSQSLYPDHAKPRFLPYCDGYDFLEGITKTAVAAIVKYPTKITIQQVDQAWYQAHHSRDGFKKSLMENPEKFGIKPNKQLKDFLDELHRRYVTFLLTNSPEDYTMTILAALDITDFFDVIIPDAKKPACFSPNSSENRELWEKLSAVDITRPDNIFYMGDHLYKDAILARQAGILTGLRMKRTDISEIERKFGKYAGIEFQRDGKLVELSNMADPTQLAQLNNILSQIYRHAHVLTTKVQNLAPILLY